MVAVDDHALDAVRSAEHRHRRLGVALGDALADVRRGPAHLALADQAHRDHLEAQGLPELGERVDGADGPVAEPEVGPDDHRHRVQPVDQHVADELRRRQPGQRRREVQHEDVVGAGGVAAAPPGAPASTASPDGVPGRTTSDGCGSNVTTTTGSGAASVAPAVRAAASARSTITR